HRGWMVLRGDHPTLHPSLRSVPELHDIAELGIFEHVFAGRGWDANLSADASPQRVRGARVTASVFPALGVAPALGRWFEPDEDRPGGPSVVVISHALWKNALGGESSVIGARLLLENEPWTVIGVMPPRFLLWGSDFWLPARLDPGAADRADRWLAVQGVLAPDVSLEQANAALALLARRWAAEHQSLHPEYRELTLEASSLLDAVLRDVRPALWALLAASALLMIAAAANLGGVLLATLSDRQRELAVRRALGATRATLVRQLLAEVLVPSFIAGLLGYFLAVGLLRWMVGLIPFGYIPAETIVSANGWGLAAAITLALAGGLAIASLGASGLGRWSERSGADLRLRSGTGSLSRSRLIGGLVVVQVSVAVAVASSGAHVVESVRRQHAASIAFSADDTMTARLHLPRHRYQQRHERVALYQRIREESSRATRISHAALAGSLPMGGGAARAVIVPGATPELAAALREVRIQVSVGDYLEALGVPLLAGRFPDERDREGGQAVVAVSEELARRLGGPEAALGRRVAIEGWGDEEPREVVGIVADHLHEELGGTPRPALFVPLAQASTAPASLVIIARGEGGPARLLDAARAAVAGVDTDLPLSETRTLGQLVREAAGGRRLASAVLGLFTALAAGLAFLGVFGLVSHGVAQRTRELGVRLALGAHPSHLFAEVLGRALALAVAGAGAGLALAWTGGRLLQHLVVGLDASEPALVAVVAFAALLLCAAAALAPALRAASVSPVEALRSE
ncbi:MAG TPA: ABC transporter permease, partial [Thermoanaerobaculia bacterium]|nr:ABC transporter permease [Thermoanaerobaculia bacterium]